MNIMTCRRGGHHQALQISRMSRVGLVSLGILLGSSILTPVLAFGTSENDRLKELEAQLGKAMGMIISLQKEIGALKKTDDTGGVKPEGMKQVAQEVQENTERLDDMEDVVLNLEDKTGSRALVKAFDAVSIDIGGFLHSVAAATEELSASINEFNQ